MVNNREKILNILKSNNSIISGEEISSTLGISRTAVWKNIKILQENGYLITTTPFGYTLEHSDDLLLPYEFNKDSNFYIYHKSTESTMISARKLAQKSKTIPWSVVLSEEQSGGISKDGSKFISPKGGVYFTIIAKPGLSIMEINLYPMAALVAINEVLTSEIGESITSKWPFDTYLSKNKISGVIHEFSVLGNRVSWITIGVGINTGTKIPRREIISKIRERVIKLFESPENISPLYIDSLNIMGKTIGFKIDGDSISGRVESIDKLGTIALMTEKGLEFIYIGDSSQEE